MRYILLDGKSLKKSPSTWSLRDYLVIIFWDFLAKVDSSPFFSSKWALLKNGQKCKQQDAKVQISWNSSWMRIKASSLRMFIDEKYNINAEIFFKEGPGSFAECFWIRQEILVPLTSEKRAQWNCRLVPSMKKIFSGGIKIYLTPDTFVTKFVAYLKLLDSCTLLQQNWSSG